MIRISGDMGDCELTVTMENDSDDPDSIARRVNPFQHRSITQHAFARVRLGNLNYHSLCNSSLYHWPFIHDKSQIKYYFFRQDVTLITL